MFGKLDECKLRKVGCKQASRQHPNAPKSQDSNRATMFGRVAEKLHGVTSDQCDFTFNVNSKRGSPLQSRFYLKVWAFFTLKYVK